MGAKRKDAKGAKRRIKPEWVAILYSGSWEDLSEETYKKPEGRE